MHDDPIDEVLDRLRSRSAKVPPFAPENVWPRLAVELRRHARARRSVRRAGVATLVIASFVGGIAFGRITVDSGEGTVEPVVPSVALEVQRSGTSLIAQLASVPGTVDLVGGSESARQAQAVALSILRGTASELSRIDPSDQRVAEILRLSAEAGRLFPQEGRSHVR